MILLRWHLFESLINPLLFQTYHCTNDNPTRPTVEQLLGCAQCGRLLCEIRGLCGHCARTQDVRPNVLSFAVMFLLVIYSHLCIWINCVCVTCNAVWLSRGVWNVPYLARVYLVKASLLQTELSAKDLFSSDSLDSDMAFCHNARNKVTSGFNWKET